MKERALLVEIEKEKEREIERRFEEQKKRYKEEEPQKNPEEVRLFSAKTYPTSIPKIKQTTPSKEESKPSKVIETPNYDFIEELSEKERERVYVLEKEEEQKPHKKPSLFLKVALIILFGIFGIWGIVNLTQINTLSSQVAQIESEYNMNLISYLNNLRNLDATNSENMQNLLDTIPDQELSPSGFEKQSNWFDRFCNFLGGMFGG